MHCKMLQSGRLLILTPDIPHLSLMTLSSLICGLSNPLQPFMCHKKPVLLQHHFAWASYLIKHLNRKLVEFFLQGLTKGFRIEFDYDSVIACKSAKSNMLSARSHAEVRSWWISSNGDLSRSGCWIIPNRSYTRWLYQQIWSHPQEPPTK